MSILYTHEPLKYMEEKKTSEIILYMIYLYFIVHSPSYIFRDIEELIHNSCLQHRSKKLYLE